MKIAGEVPIAVKVFSLAFLTIFFSSAWHLAPALAQNTSSIVQYRTAPQLFSRTDSRAVNGVVFDSLSADETALTQEFDDMEDFGGRSKNSREAHFRSYIWATQEKPGSPTEGEGFKDEELVGQIAKQLTYYESAQIFASWAKESRIAEEYRKTTRALKKCQDLTRVAITRAPDGSFSVNKSGDRLLEFKIHASARTGVSPVLKLSNNWMLRYGFSENETLLEYELNF